MFFGMFAVLAEFERELIAEKTKAGLAAARARGRNGGRPRKMDKQTIKMAMNAMSDRNTIAKDVAKRLGLFMIMLMGMGV
jgi:DNA invertase Pin-like site-specific DNA recombinase